MIDGFDGSRVLVTGASAGLGKALAHGAHERGATVIASGRNESELAKLASELGERVEVLPADLAQPGEAERLVERAGRVDVAVACAGLTAMGYLNDLSDDSINRALDVNLRAPIHLSKAALSQMHERDSGQLVFVSSLIGKIPSPAGSIYCCTKAAIRTFAAGLREDLRGTGVGVTMVAPGPIAGEGAWARSGAALPRWVRLPDTYRVAAKILHAVERDRGELEPAPLIMRSGGWAIGAMPRVVTTISRRLWTVNLAERLVEANRGRF
jgi:short-subunit dehydrogenase